MAFYTPSIALDVERLQPGQFEKLESCAVIEGRIMDTAKR